MANKRRATIEDCKLLNLRLLESSSKLFNPELKKATLELSMTHTGSFCLPSENEGIDFYLNINTEITARKAGTENEDGLLATISANFRADFMILPVEKNLDQFKRMAETIGSQLYPTTRMFFADMLLIMGIPINLPWSIVREDMTKSKRNPLVDRK